MKNVLQYVFFYGLTERQCTVVLSLSQMGIFRLSLEVWLFDGPLGHSQDSSEFAEKSCIDLHVYVLYNRELLMLCTPAMITSAVLYGFSLS